ncbi:extracellular tyrosine-protein kinase PKDCC-like [Callorhinchus milii]|uniref:extracellular tyrosine-protein kinase PKDCC-like n=1 Tax=Callorhinchus milii TaxID=7868 RepID=UPI001C3FC63E|nr:extracellular tyrosine-protein kinase PKDCC-like [Callorhinchus milii]
MRKVHMVSVSTALVCAAALLVRRLSTGGKSWTSQRDSSTFSSRQRERLLREIAGRVEDILSLREAGAHPPSAAAHQPQEEPSPRGSSRADGGVALRAWRDAAERAVGNLTRGTIGCSDLRHLTGVRFLGSGDTKTVSKGELEDGTGVALKSVNGRGEEVGRCVRRYGLTRGCHSLAACKIVKEIALLQRLRHPNIIQWFGQCYNDRLEDVAVITAVLELGTPVEMIQLLQTPWEERFRICLNLINLLHYLAHSPLGSVVLLDFHPRQFVIVNGELKVTDLDDISTEELSCKEDSDCTLAFPTRNFNLQCSTEEKCQGINEKRNLYNAFRYFFMYLLPHSAPPALTPLLNDIMNATEDLRYGINKTLEMFGEVLDIYKSGLYRINRSQSYLKDYKVVQGFHVQGNCDYKCWPSYNHQRCLLSAHDVEEAATICHSHRQCQSFVITQQTTWTGRILTLFQSCINLIQDTNSTVYMKSSSLKAPL